MRDNIIWTQSGYDLNVDPSVDTSLASDYNDLYVTGSGKVGRWQSAPQAGLFAWQTASQNDPDSISADPLFVNAAGGDFHVQSVNGSFHGGSSGAGAEHDDGPADDRTDAFADKRRRQLAGDRSRRRRRCLQPRARAQRQLRQPRRIWRHRASIDQPPFIRPGDSSQRRRQLGDETDLQHHVARRPGRTNRHTDGDDRSSGRRQHDQHRDRR